MTDTASAASTAHASHPTPAAQDQTAHAERMTAINAARKADVRRGRERIAAHHLGHSRLRAPFARAALDALEPRAGTALYTALRRCTTALGRAAPGDADLIARALGEALRVGRAKSFTREWFGQYA